MKHPSRSYLTLGTCLAVAMLTLAALPTHALPLEVLGIGNSSGWREVDPSVSAQLIYDPNLDVTWYDHAITLEGWQGSMNRAESLVVNFGGVDISGWSLPSAFNPDGSSGGHMQSLYLGLGNVPFPEQGHHDSPDLSPFTGLLPFNISEIGVSASFWTKDLLSTDFGYTFARAFDFKNGVGTGASSPSDVPYAVAIHQGRIGVPDTGGTLLMLAVALAGLWWVRGGAAASPSRL